jgi:hypothetical protein
MVVSAALDAPLKDFRKANLHRCASKEGENTFQSWAPAVPGACIIRHRTLNDNSKSVLDEGRLQMKNRFLASTVVFVWLVSTPGAAQAPKSSAKTWNPPRMADGHPDLQGIWNYSTLTPMERPRELAGKAFLSEQEAAEFENRAQQTRNVDLNRETKPTARGLVNGTVETEDLASAYNEFWWDRGTKLVSTRRTSLVIDPPDGRIPPLTPQAQKRLATLDEANQRLAEGPEDRPLSERCIVRPNSGPPMTPTGYNNNFQLIQAPGYVVIFNEQIHDARIVPMGSQPHLPQTVRQWMGDSRGHWEGDTLIIDTTNFTAVTNFRGSGENMHLVERFTRTDPGTLLYEFTVDDPLSFTRRWTGQIPMKRTQEPMYEYACHEGNYSMFTTLSGARALERK